MKRNLRDTFIYFAKNDCQNSSKLYENSAIAIAEDKEMLAVVSQIPYEQPAPNLLFAAFNYLLKHRIDRYQFAYGNQKVGDEQRELTLASDNRGDDLPDSIHLPMQIVTRIGMTYAN